MNDKSSITFLGRYGMLFTDEDAVVYSVNIEKIGDTIILYHEGIKAINKHKILNDKDIEIIISKILSLQPNFEWEVK